MVKVTVLYPSVDGSTFDMDYYRTKHAEIVMRTMKPERFEIDKGQDGQPFHAMGHLIFASAEAMQAGMGSPDAGEAMADIPNYYSGQPQIQISEVVD
ncbi:MAG: EthD family reductase [Ilumatobacteraceae bacterium]